MTATKRRGWVGAGVLLAALAAGRCGGPPAEPTTSGIVRVAMTNDPSSLSLIGRTDRNSEIIAYLVTDSLVRYDGALGLQPLLARSWELSPDGRSLVFRLREGVRWQDGTPFTARDVVFTVEKVRDPATQARSYSAQFEDLISVDAPDPLTVRAVYAREYADVLESWTLPIIPEHLAGADPDLLTGAFSQHPVGCGPFRLARWDPGRELRLEANAQYWQGRPSVDGISFRIVPDVRTAYEALLRGELDLMHVTPDLWREFGQNRGSEGAARLEGFVYYRLNLWYIGWNLDGTNPFFTDRAVRRAMVMALDRPRFISQVLFDLARPAVGTYHPDSPWAHPGLEPWPHDPAGARALLEASGWTDRDGDGVRERDGVEFSFRLLVPASTQEITDRIAAWVQQSLAEIGVRMEIERLEWRAFQERRREHAFQAAMATLFFTPVPDQYELFHSSARTDGLNYGGYSDPEVDRLLEEGRATHDPLERGKVYRRLQETLHEEESLSALFYFASPVLLDERLEGVQRTPLGIWHVVPGPRQWHWSSGPRAE